MAHPPVGMILAAGFGQRLQPLSLLRPKPIMEIAAKPIVYFLLRILEKAGIKDVVLNLHHHSQQIRTALTRYQFNCRIHLVYEKDILDTAGGVANAIRKLGINNRKMVIIHGDIIGDIDLRPLVERDNFISLVCAEDRYIEGYRGNVAVDSRGHIVELGRFFVSQRSVRKRGFFTGLQILSEQAVSLIKDCSKESLVKDVYPRFLNQGRILSGVIMPLFYNDLGTAKRIFSENMAILGDLSQGAVRPNFLDSSWSITRDKIARSGDVTIADSARLMGPLIIARGARIGALARLGPNVVIGERAIIGEGAKLTNTVIMSDTVIGKDERLNCTIGLGSARVFVKPS